MQTREAHRIESGWEVIARDGSPAGTVIAVTEDEITIDPVGDSDEPVNAPMNLVIEAHGGHAFVDLGPEELGLSRSGGEDTAPETGPKAPPDVLRPDHLRRLTGG